MTDAPIPALTRRTLLQGAMAASIAAPAIAHAAPATSLKAQLLLAPDLLYFNAANIAPAFRSVVAAQDRGTHDFQANPSREYREKYPVLATRLRQRLAARLGVTADEIALVRNSSEANTVAVLGLDLKPGDEIIVTDHNHQSTLDSWKLRARREGLVLKTIKTPVSATSPQAVADLFAQAITPRTKAIFLSHMTNVTGLVFPVALIAGLARAKGIWLHVDGAQTFGWMKLDLAALGCDSYSGSTHKWLMGPLEGGMLYVRRARMDELSPIMRSHGYWLTDEKNMATAQRYEILGQRDDPKIEAILTTLDALDTIGEAAIETQARAGGEAMRDVLTAVPGTKLVGSRHPALSGPVLTMAFPGKDVAALRKRLWAEGKLATAAASAQGQSLIRFSPHIYNDTAEMRAVADLLKGG
ncbi:aminotransferase class V-fold PLP-dependent enzyme [Sphingomonas naphthae]|uniref:Aminotransferase class V-fold PLP-dependent enzyme n=1 Tax=Sphingomonas naphthae TaxID=1813468 RepID=A0ABY7TPS6_9SPHN|nr:aminotransferase class V-fold PLP-dependent enzyme [Sphingomonas naphthae]WCT74637.1 aminotransferase class V-fold PLP-dependent enzyme [Sphingomonas naphthae]